MTEERVQRALAELVKEVGAIIAHAHDVLPVTQALSSLASLLFNNNLMETSLGDPALFLRIKQLASVCKDESSCLCQNKNQMEVLRELFYGGPAFSSMAKILLFRVVPDWLACFSSTEQIYLFDSFFTFAPPSECLLSLTPALARTYYNDEDGSFPVETASMCAIAERLLVVSLFDNAGVIRIAVEYASRKDTMASTLAQFMASIPDKARPNAPSSLRSPYFYFLATSQLLDGAEKIFRDESCNNERTKGRFLLVGEALGKFCSRGHADIVASQMLHRLLPIVEEKSNLRQAGKDMASSNADDLIDIIDNISKSSSWGAIIGCITSVHAVERCAKALLQEMADKKLKDWEAFCILSVLFSGLLSEHTTIRLLFTERFLLWDVFPICCLRWILHFGVFGHVPRLSGAVSGCNANGLRKDVIRHLIEVWAGEGFLQSCDVQQQYYISAAVGLSLQAMKKEDLESSSNLMQMLLEGISRRLESPLDMVRMMAKKVALAFSLVLNEKNPLLLDEEDQVETLSNWEQLAVEATAKQSQRARLKNIMDVEPENEHKIVSGATTLKQKTRRKNRVSSEAYDPDEIIDLGTYEPELYADEETESSEHESESSLEPYDLSDDESDLNKTKLPTQLTECVANLRRGDEPDLVERALEVVEKFIRALPDELENTAPDLARALIHVRCSAIAIEGEEQSVEDKRFNALVALLACAPKVVGVFGQELYSPNVDVSQRLLVLEVMSDAARELASTSNIKASRHLGNKQPLLAEIDATWYGPGSAYPLKGAGPWRPVNDSDTMVSFIRKYERELPHRPGSRTLGKPRRWGERSILLRQRQRHEEMGIERKNMFVPLAASFMLPAMRDYDRKQHGVDLLGRDFVVLGRLICMLAVCIECVSMHPEALILGGGLLNMLRSKQISNHPEVYVRRASLYAASRVAISLHPAHVASAVGSGDLELSDGLDWIRAWALKAVEDDKDTESSSMAMVCLHLHSELMLQASRSMESEKTNKNDARSISYKVAGSNPIFFK